MAPTIVGEKSWTDRGLTEDRTRLTAIAVKKDRYGWIFEIRARWKKSSINNLDSSSDTVMCGALGATQALLSLSGHPKKKLWNSPQTKTSPTSPATSQTMMAGLAPCT